VITSSTPEATEPPPAETPATAWSSGNLFSPGRMVSANASKVMAGTVPNSAENGSIEPPLIGRNGGRIAPAVPALPSSCGCGTVRIFSFAVESGPRPVTAMWKMPAAPAGA
jgi:hypothetical protein